METNESSALTRSRTFSQRLKNFVVGNIPGMIGHEVAQTCVYGSMLNEIQKNERSSSQTNFYDKVVYVYNNLMFTPIDFATYLCGAGLAVECYERGNGLAGLVLGTHLITRAAVYSFFYDASEMTREAIVSTLDKKAVSQ